MMITLRNKLYESLLGDEDELVNNDSSLIDQWAGMLGLVKLIYKQHLTDNTTNCYYVDDNNKVYTSNINPNIIFSQMSGVKREYELKIEDILPEYVKFESIAGIMLGLNQTSYSCPDTMANNGLKKLSKYPIESLVLLYGDTKLNRLDFNLVGQNKLKKLTIRIPRLGDEYYVDIEHWPKFKLDTLWIESRQRPVILDNIKGLNCKNFIFEGARFSEDSYSKLTLDDPSKSTASLDNTEKGIAIIDRFFQNNKVDNLIYLRRFNMKAYKYRIDKKGRGKGYKLTRLA